jgi:hypothetical protein
MGVEAGEHPHPNPLPQQGEGILRGAGILPRYIIGIIQ